MKAAMIGTAFAAMLGGFSPSPVPGPRPAQKTYSLRSRDDRVDVSEIAKSNGGGGHRNAAGFRVLHAV